MVRHNNMIPNGHFRKKWQTHIKTWFNQPMKKVQRRNRRIAKLNRLAPRPIQLLRPVVHCPSIRYHSVVRTGRGFTLQEIEQAGFNEHYARTIGIAVDHRRRNRSVESIVRNVQRLKEYKERLILYPLAERPVIIKVDSGKDLNKIKLPDDKLKGRKVTDDEKNFEAYVTLRRARCDAKCFGVRSKKKRIKKEAFENAKNQ